MTKTTTLLLSGTLLLTATACGDDADPAGAGGAGGAGGESASPMEYAVLVRGPLFTADIDEAQAYHDTLASAGEQDAKALGDFGHDAMLGTSLLGTAENTFLGLDRWSDAQGLQTFYANPDFAEAFGMLFSAPPTLETFVHQPEWHGWGKLTSGDTADVHYFVIVRGHLAEADPDAARAAHDMVAAGGQEAAEAAGDQAHVVFTGLDEPREFLAIDIWHDDTNIEALYTNPDFGAAFGALFDSPPTLTVFRSTDWHQW